MVSVLAPLAAAGALVLSACTSSVTVESQFPTPLIEPLPVHMGVIFDDALKNYVYTEDVPQQSKWAITLGDANVAMLKPLFATMFASVHQVQKVPLTGAQAAGIDGVIRPELQKFEFEVPTGDKPNQFVEVWMQFKLTLFQPDGKVIAEWPVSGYGKAELLGRAQDAVDKAAIVALRDVGAAISTKFAVQPDVSRWLQERRNVPLSAASGS